MTEEPAVKSAEPESPTHGPESNPLLAAGSARSAWAARVTANPAAATRRGRPRWKKILVPTVLAILGVGLVAIAFAAYPRRGEVKPAAGAIAVINANSSYVGDHTVLVWYVVTTPAPA
jgi:hypothetical protein